MRVTHGFDAKVMRDDVLARLYHRHMLNTEFDHTRTLTVVLPESEWRALRDIEPDAVKWIREQISNRLAHQSDRQAETSQFAFDDY